MDWFDSIICLWKKIQLFFRCYFGHKPPRGDPPINDQRIKVLSEFPQLRTWSVTGPSSGQYNCIAWSISITNQWFWPGNTVLAFDAFYASHGWTVSNSYEREYKKRKVALYARNNDENDCQHGSRETHDCGWHESKCGNWERIMHIRTELENGSYGNAIRCYEKQDNMANLDLCKV